MRIGQMLRTALVALSCIVITSAGLSQEKVNGQTALILSYRAKPELRARFRSLMSTEGIAQLDRWKKDGVFTSYQALFTTYAAENTPDMFVILRFAHFTDLGRWQKIEQTEPGGLPERAQAMAVVDSSATADIVEEKTAAAPTKDSQFFVLQYDVLSDMPKYVSYVHGYVTPQFDAWIKSGVLGSYAAFVNQNPAGAPWSSFMVLEYRNLDSLAAREVVKSKARTELAASDPVWKKWSEDKSAIRREKAGIAALSLR